MRTALICFLSLWLSIAYAGETSTANSKSSASSTSASSSTSTNGKTTERSYVRRTKDGKVVEERGDRSLLRELPAGAGELPDLEEMMRRMQREMGATDARTRTDSSSHSRRVVTRDGRKVVDEEHRDGRRVKGDERPEADRPRPSRKRSSYDDLVRKLRQKDGVGSRGNAGAARPNAKRPAPAPGGAKRILPGSTVNRKKGQPRR